MATLFEEGMGVDAPKHEEPGVRQQKLGVMPTHSQKYFNAQRDQPLKQGTI